MDASTHNIRNSSASNTTQMPPPNYAAPAAPDHMDPKRLRRLVMNREYAQRCRLKKQEYIQQLLRARNAEEAKIAMLSPQASFYQSQIEMLETENAALRQKIHEMEAQASIDDAQISQLKFEKETLKMIHMM